MPRQLLDSRPVATKEKKNEIPTKITYLYRLEREKKKKTEEKVVDK